MPSEVTATETTSRILEASHLFAVAENDYIWSSPDLDHEVAVNCADAGDYGASIVYAAGYDLVVEQLDADMIAEHFPGDDGRVYATCLSGDDDIALVGIGMTRVLDPADNDDARVIAALRTIGR